MASSSDVAIIGGGVIGLSAAVSLRQAGLTVTLVERGEPGAEASSAAAGMLAPQLESPGPGPMLELCLRARGAYRPFLSSLASVTDVDVEYRDAGSLLVASSELEAAKLDAMVGWQRAMGLRAELLTPAQLRALEPALTGEVTLAVHLPDDHQLDNRKLVAALVAACRTLGVTFLRGRATSLLRERGRATGVTVERDEKVAAGAVVLAAGAWSSLLPELLPQDALRPARGQMLQYRLHPPPFRHALWNEHGYLVSRDDGRVLAGSTVEVGEWEPRVTDSGQADIRRAVEALVPALRSAPLEQSWAGLRPHTRDGLPVLGGGPLERLFLATGHFRNGILLAPLTARLVTEWARGERPHVDLRPFRYERLLER